MAANLSNLKQISSNLLAYQNGGVSINTLLQNFFKSPGDSTYNPLKIGLVSAKNSLLPTGRILVANSDGRVLYDSSKSDSLNTYTNFSTSSINVTAIAPSVPGPTSVPISGLINENHSGRPEMLQATLTSAGYGSAIRYSDTSNTQNFYWATRLGTSVEFPVGLFRINLPIT